MHKLLFTTTALICFATSAAAAPVFTAWALIQSGVGWSAAIGAAFGVSSTFVSIAGSLLLSAASAALSRTGYNTEAVFTELSRPTALPAYRFAYGAGWVPGTPAGFQVVGDIFYGVWILNSRESEGPFTLLLDKRTVEASGDPYDFAGAGAQAVNEPFVDHLTYWIGKGDQTSCPDVIVAESDYFAATDAWQGKTVLWMRLDAGSGSARYERWPSTPPEVVLEGNWSQLYDPRTGLTTHSRNQALAVLDAMMRNPVRPYLASQLDLESFARAADVADTLITNKDASQTPQFQCDGVLVWSDGSEIEDQLDPLLAAGASRLIRVGGRRAIVPAVYVPPAVTLDEFVGDSLELQRLSSKEDLLTEAVATYTAPDRAYETAESPAYVLAGAQAEDGGAARSGSLSTAFVIDHRQAQRLAKIAVMRTRMQRAVSGVAPPSAFELLAGSTCTLNMPTLKRWNGVYEVEEIAPALIPSNADQVAMRCPIVLRQTSPEIYAWDAATEEQDVEGATFDPFIARLQTPSALALSSGTAAAEIIGNTITPRVRVDVTADPNATVEWQYETRPIEGTQLLLLWHDGDDIGPDAADATGARTGYISPASLNVIYTVRARTKGNYGSSDWTAEQEITPTAPESVLVTPELSATGGTGSIAVHFDQSPSRDASGLQILIGPSADPDDATLIDTIAAGPNVSGNRTYAKSAGTYYVFARAIDQFSSASAVSAGAVANVS
ncbi:phage tail protein [Albirhodobacter sp. R86504]|uniref:phage tail protein n=1 Tax=Albirhodobacter sp. R86504 TaxID=3093848 RepID=UPI0036725C3B